MGIVESCWPSTSSQLGKSQTFPPAAPEPADPPCAAICSLSEVSFSLAVSYFSVAAALIFVCSATAVSAVVLAVFFFAVSCVMSSAEQGSARGVTIADKAVIRGVTPAGLLVKVSVISSINLSKEKHVVGTSLAELAVTLLEEDCWSI